MEAVKQNGLALQYASKRLRDDKEFIFEITMILNFTAQV
jgi:hypothetical protein